MSPRHIDPVTFSRRRSPAPSAEAVQEILDRAAAACNAAAEVRATHRRRRSPDRQVELEGALEALRGPARELGRELNRAQREPAFARLFERRLREASRAVRAESRRLYEMRGADRG